MLKNFLAIALAAALSLSVSQSCAQEAAAPEADNLELALAFAKLMPLEDAVMEKIGFITRKTPTPQRLALAKEISKRVDPQELIEVSAEVYAKVYTKAELEALIAFYGSAIGRSVHEKRWGVLDNYFRFISVAETAADKTYRELKLPVEQGQ